VDLWATSMGVWCDDLGDLMLPFDRLSLTRPDLILMGAGTPGFMRLFTDPCPREFSNTLKSDLAVVMAHYPMGAHLRLDLCSFKNGVGSPRAVGANGALWLLRQPNPRPAGLIRRGLEDGAELSLFLFPWMPIPQWAEFRIFIRESMVIGVSQTHADLTFPQIGQFEAPIKTAMKGFVATILPRLRLRDVAVDVFAEPTPDGFLIRLVELNPLVQRTDPCLFSWDNGGDFDGSFRFRGAGKAWYPAQNVPDTRARSLTPAPDDDVWRI
jgi:D123